MNHILAMAERSSPFVAFCKHFNLSEEQIRVVYTAAQAYRTQGLVAYRAVTNTLEHSEPLLTLCNAVAAEYRWPFPTDDLQIFTLTSDNEIPPDHPHPTALVEYTVHRTVQVSYATDIVRECINSRDQWVQLLVRGAPIPARPHAVHLAVRSVITETGDAPSDRAVTCATWCAVTAEYPDGYCVYTDAGWEWVNRTAVS